MVTTLGLVLPATLRAQVSHHLARADSGQSLISGRAATADNVLARKVTLVVHGVPLAKALHQLALNGVSLVFADQLLSGVGLVSCACEEVSLRGALDTLLRGTGLGYKVTEGGDIAIVRTPAPITNPAGGIQGRVVVEEDGAPLIGVNIQLVGTDHRTLTRQDGRYTLRNIPAGRYWIRASLLGFHPDSQQVVVVDGETATVDFKLKIDPLTLTPLEALVSTGTLVDTKRRALGNSIVVLSSEVISESGATSLFELLRGLASGVASYQPIGTAGSGGHIRVRGVSSFLGSQAPLVYVDGVPIDNGSSALTRSAQGFSADQGSMIRLDELTLEQIERIEIVKGSAATTLYGSEAINGVIQIFTKRGVPGQTRITATVEQGSARVPVGQSFIGTSPFANEIRSIFQSPRKQHYSVAINGGQGSLNYNLTGTHYRSGGVVIFNSEDQTAFNASFGATVGGDFSFHLSGNVVQRRFDQLDYHRLFEYVDSDRVVDSRNELANATTLDEAIEYIRQTETKVNRIYGSANLMWRPVENWQNHITVGLDRSLEENESIRFLEPEYVQSGLRPEGFARDRISRDITRLSARYVTTITYPQGSTVTSTLSMGAEGFRDEVRYLGIEAYGLISKDIRGFNFAKDAGFPTEEYSAIASVGGFVQEQIGIHDRLYMTAGVRVDGSSTFGDNFGLQYYPKFSASYVIEPATWWTGKLRVAWGRSGKAPDPVTKELHFRIGRTTTGLQVLDPIDPGNPDIKPELGTEIELGMEHYFLGNRAAVQANYFHQTTRNAILRMPIAGVTGFYTGPLGNIGELRSQGIELEGQFSPIQKKDLELDLGVTITHMIEDGLITEIGDNEFLTHQSAHILKGMREGWSLNDLVFTSIFDVFTPPLFGSEINAGSRVPTTYGGITARLRFLNDFRLYSHLTFGFGGRGFDWVLARRDEQAGFIWTIGFDPALARKRYIFSSDHVRLGVLRATYELSPGITRGLAKTAELWVEGRNLYTWDKFPNGDPTTVPITGYSGGGSLQFYASGAVGYAVPTAKQYSIGVRMTF